MGQKQTTIIPKAACARILIKAGARRVSADAAEALAEVLEEKAREIGDQANRISRHAGRKTVHGTDIKIAAKQ